MMRGLRWWEWAGLICMTLVLAQRVVRILANGYSFRPAWQATLLAVLIGWWAWSRWREERQVASQVANDPAVKAMEAAELGKAPLVSIVMLLRQPRYVDDKFLAAAASRAWGVDCENENFFAVGESGLFIVKGPAGIFNVIYRQAPYFDDPPAAAGEVNELRRRRAIEQHQAWCSVDVLDAKGEPKDNAYPAVGKFIAELADEDCLALYVPETRVIVPYDSDVDIALKGEDPLAALALTGPVPVIGIDEGDSGMKAAVKEARRRWPEFEAAFKARAAGQMFAVKAPIREGDVCEFMWISVSSIENGQVAGRLDNTPVDIKSIQLGDSLSVSVPEVNDWLYTGREGRPVGGFTVKVLSAQGNKRKGAK